MTIETFWQAFLIDFPEYKDTELPIAWQFGVYPDELAQLVVDGIKTATASGYRLYEVEQEDLPPVNGLNIILNSHNEPVCITRTLEVRLMPFNEVPASFAYLEGEGDRTLAYWQQVHLAFFTNIYSDYGLTFTEDDLIVGEIFECLYAK